MQSFAGKTFPKFYDPANFFLRADDGRFLDLLFHLLSDMFHSCSPDNNLHGIISPFS